MTIKTHALLAALTTAAVVGFIYYRSSGDENARMKKVIAQTEAAAQARKEAEAEKPAPKEKAAKPAVPEAEKPVEPEKTAVKAEKPQAKPQDTAAAKPQPKDEGKTAAKPQPKAETKAAASPGNSGPEPDDFLPSRSLVKNNDFKKGLESWRYWRTTEENGKKYIEPKAGSLVIDGQSNTLMGVAQTIKVVSNTVYRISAKVRSLDHNQNAKEFMGARLAFNAPYQKEQQIVWLYKDSEWREQSLVFTNRFTGLATIFFHTGYTKPQAKCEVADILFIPQENFPKSNECATNGSFKEEFKGWDFWNVKGEEASNAVSRVTDNGETCVLIKGQPGGKLIGMCQAINLTSGAVYKLSVTAKSEDRTPKAFFGARAALFAAGQKEKQLLWTYNTKDWVEKELVFTNSVSGAATLFFHTGYTTNACQALFKNISLIKKK